MAISRYAAASDALVALAAADATLTAAEVQVVDGPPTQQQYGTTVLYIGWTGEDDNATSGSIESSYHDLGPTAKRDERVEVYCTAISVRGDDDMSTARSAAVAVYGALETAIRANVSLGLADVLRFEVSDATVRQVRDGMGIGVEVGFTITCIALI